MNSYPKVVFAEVLFVSLIFMFSAEAQQEETEPSQAEQTGESVESAQADNVQDDSEVQSSPPEQTEQGASGQVQTSLRCRDIVCQCGDEPIRFNRGLVIRGDPALGWCRQVTCGCSGTSALQTRSPNRDEYSHEAVLTRSLRWLDERPPPLGGYILGRGQIGLGVEVGLPYMDFYFVYAPHQLIQFSFGYQGMYGFSSAPYGTLKIMLAQSRVRRTAISFQVSGGYRFVHSRRDSYDGYDSHNEISSWIGGDSGFLDVLLGASVGYGRHAFIVHSGVEFGWVEEVQCNDPWGYGGCWSQIFPEGESGVLYTFLFDFGYALAIGNRTNFYITSGVNFFTNSRSFPVMARVKIGFIFDLLG